MKRDSAVMSFPGFDDQWVEDLPPEGLGHGCTSAAFEVVSSGVIDDLKSAITARLSHRRFGLYKRQFRLTQNGIL